MKLSLSFISFVVLFSSLIRTVTAVICDIKNCDLYCESVDGCWSQFGDFKKGDPRWENKKEKYINCGLNCVLVDSYEEPDKDSDEDKSEEEYLKYLSYSYELEQNDVELKDKLEGKDGDEDEDELDYVLEEEDEDLLDHVLQDELEDELEDEIEDELEDEDEVPVAFNCSGKVDINYIGEEGGARCRSPLLSHIFELSTDQPDTNALHKQVVSRKESAFLVNISQPLGPDPSVGSRMKSICYFMIGTDNIFRKLSQDFIIQPTLYNNHPKQGGVKRHYKLLSDNVVGSSPMIKILNFFREHFSLSPGTVVLCQIQSSLEEDIKDDITEQGIHTDGADDTMILCLERKNVDGAENLLYKDVYGKYPLIPPTVLEEGEAIFWNDNRVYHGVTPMSPENPNKGPAVRTVMLLHANSDYVLDGRNNEKNTLPGRK